MTLALLLDGDPTDVVVHVGDEQLTRRELDARVEALTDALRSVHITAGVPVGVMLGNDAGVVTALFGVWRSGAVYVPLNPRLTDAEVTHLRETVPLAAIVTTDDHAARFPDLPIVVLEAPMHAQSASGSPERGDGEVVGYEPDIALVQMTSGTTGAPKPVLLKHSGVLQLLDGVLASMGGSGQREQPMPNLIPVSLSLWAGIYQVLFAFRVGAPVVLMARFDTRAFAALVARHGIKSVVLPPAAMAMLADDESVTSLDPLRYVRSITAPLSPFQARRFHDRFGVAILNCYGQTEIGGEIVGWSAADWREHGDDKLGSVGRPHTGVEVKVDDGGELLVRTPALSAGYADGRDFSDRVRDGWFRTGDLGRVDDEGFVWIEGRASEMINRGGLKVFPGDVEEVLRAAPGVDDAAVVGIEDDRLGEVPVAFVVSAVALDADGLEAHCREHLAPYKVPVRFVPIDALPRNDVGKVRKVELTQLATTGRNG